MERYKSPDDPERKRRGARRGLGVLRVVSTNENPDGTGGVTNQDKKIPVKPVDVAQASLNALNRGVVAEKAQEEKKEEDTGEGQG